MPPPAILQQFGQIVPGAAKAILDDFLAEGDHRRRLERTAARSEAIQRIGGLCCAVGISFVALLLAYDLFQQGKNGGRIAATLTALAPLVGTLLFSRHRRTRDGEHGRGERAQQLELQL